MSGQQAYDRTTAAVHSTGAALKKGTATAYSWTTGTLWQFYSIFLAGIAEKVIPAHTRDGFFQIWCDLRTNVPKDSKWLHSRTAALKPHTLPGWVALSSLLLFASAGSFAVLCASLASLAIATYVLIGAGIVAGLFAAFWLFVFSGVFFVASLVVGWMAGCFFLGYAWLSAVLATSRYLGSLVASKRGSGTPKVAENNQATGTTARVPTASEGQLSSSHKRSPLLTTPNSTIATSAPPKPSANLSQSPDSSETELPDTVSAVTNKPSEVNGFSKTTVAAGNGSSAAGYEAAVKQAKLQGGVNET